MFAKKPADNTSPPAPAMLGKNAQGKAIMNRQFNSPIGMYASDTIANTLEAKMESVSLDDKYKSSPQG